MTAINTDYATTIARVGQIQDQISGLAAAFAPPSTAGASSTSPATPAAVAGSSSVAAGSGPSTSFAAQLATALSPTASAGSGVGSTGLGSTGLSSAGLGSAGLGSTGLDSTAAATALPTGASSQLTSDQQQFASRLATDTGLDPGVVSAWLLAEESGGAATARQGAGNNDWLNIGYTDSATYGSGDSVWSDPVSAADATAGWLKGQNTIPGYGVASSGVQAILATAGQPPATQIAALQHSGWASSGYPDLPSLYTQIAA